jgi:hypothetical protein
MSDCCPQPASNTVVAAKKVIVVAFISFLAFCSFYYSSSKLMVQSQWWDFFPRYFQCAPAKSAADTPDEMRMNDPPVPNFHSRRVIHLPTHPQATRPAPRRLRFHSDICSIHRTPFR